MKYVLDASVALKWVLPEIHADVACHLLDQFSNGDIEFHAPDVFLAEIAHALTRAERRKTILPGQAETFITDILISLPLLHSSLPLIQRAVAISAATGASSYDALYLALAEEQQCELITADQKLIAKFPQFPIIDLASL